MSAAAPARKGPQPGQMKPTELMQACGSKSGQWQPESPDHWRWQLKNGEGPERALAWVKLNSIGRASPCCVNAAGERLRIEHMAADCDWKIHTAENYCALLVSEGRIRIQRGKAIWYRADVPESSATAPDEDPNSRVHGSWPTYLIDFIKSLPPEKKVITEAYEEWRRRLFADGMAALRRIDEQVQDSTLLAVGVNEKDLPERPPDKPRTVALAQHETPAFIGSRVQGRDVYAAESGSVRGSKTAPILIGVNSSLAIHTKSVSQSGAGPTDRHEDAPDYAAQFTDLKTLLIGEYGRRFPGETPSSKLCASIITELQGAPLERLRVHIRQRMQAATGMGFALSLAQDVGRRWAEEKEARAKAETARLAEEKRLNEHYRAQARAVLADPEAHPRDIEWAKELLAEKAAAAGGAS